MSGPLVDVVIPLHRADRKVETAVGSAQRQVQGIETRVSVVLHNLGMDETLRQRVEPGARVLTCDDGVPSPSGPRNVGLDAATAPFVFFLDSDDALSPLCLRRLHEVACAKNADIVLPSIRRGRSYVGSPLVASRRVKLLDPVRHYLFLRSHVPALLRRSTMIDSGIRYPDGIRVSEDFAVMAQLFATGRTAMAFDAVYDVLDNGDQRASTVPISASEQLAALRLILGSRWIDELTYDQRRALVRRILAVNLASGWRWTRSFGLTASGSEYAAIRDTAIEKSAGAVEFLSVRDRVTLHFQSRPRLVERMLGAKPFGLVPSTWRAVFSLRSPLVFEFRSWLVRHRRRVLVTPRMGHPVTERGAEHP